MPLRLPLGLTHEADVLHRRCHSRRGFVAGVIFLLPPTVPPELIERSVIHEQTLLEKAWRRPTASAFGHAGRSTPYVLEWFRGHRSITHRVGDRGMPEIMLEPSGVHSASRQCVAGRVPEHVNVNRERQPSGFASPFNHPSSML